MTRHSEFSASLPVRGCAFLVAVMYALNNEVLKAQTGGEQFTSAIHTFDCLGTIYFSCLEISVSFVALLLVVPEHQIFEVLWSDLSC